MIQGTLALTIGKPIKHTYTAVTQRRRELWEERGFELLQLLRKDLEDLNSGQDQENALTTLLRINHTASEISTLDPRWLDYSVSVFLTLLDYNHLKKSVQAKRLSRKFTETLEALYGRPTAS